MSTAYITYNIKYNTIVQTKIMRLVASLGNRNLADIFLAPIISLSNYFIIKIIILHRILQLKKNIIIEVVTEECCKIKLYLNE